MEKKTHTQTKNKKKKKKLDISNRKKKNAIVFWELNKDTKISGHKNGFKQIMIKKKEKKEKIWTGLRIEKNLKTSCGLVDEVYV